MWSSKILTFILNFILILFVILFGLFFVYVYQDNKYEETVIEIIDISENQGEIKPIIISENKEEQKILEMEPAVIQQDSKENNDNDIYTGFYYNQLDKYSKLIYKSLEEQIQSLETGNITIILPKEISELLEEYEIGNVEAVFSVAINAFEYDNPEIFYLDASKLVLYYEKDTLGNYNIYLKSDNQYSNYLYDGFNNKQDVQEAQRQIDAVVKEIQDKLQNLRTNYEKVLYIHDWLVDNIKYDETLNRTNRNNIYGAFIEKEVTCGGYAKAFKYLIDKLNIDCIIVQGIATTDGKTENHAWNYINLNENWYGVDCTWDDPIIIGEASNQRFYTYFLKDQNTFENHKPLETFFGTTLKLEYPELVINN